MNWIKENKFLFGFLVVMLLGVGVLGALLMGARGQYEEALTSYQDKAAELSNLQKKSISPTQKNLEKLAEQKKQASDKVTELLKALAAQQIPAEQITPAGFQDKLKAAVSALRTKAERAPKPVKLGDGPEKFFLGFEMYETAPPDADAAVALARQLKVIEWVVGKLIESQVSEIKPVVRTELPEEKGKGKAPAAKGEKSSKVSVHKHPFEIAFVAEQGNFKEVLNAIVDYKGQFLVPRLVTVKNTKETGPQRIVAGAAIPPAPTGDAGAGAAAAPSATYIVGEEKVEVRLLLEAVDFTDPASK